MSSVLSEARYPPRVFVIGSYGWELPDMCAGSELWSTGEQEGFLNILLSLVPITWIAN